MGSACRILGREGRYLLGKKSYSATRKQPHPQKERVMTVTQDVHRKGKEAGQRSSEIMDFLSGKRPKYEV